MNGASLRERPAALIAAAALVFAAAPADAQQLYDFGAAFARAADVDEGVLFLGEPFTAVRPPGVYTFGATDGGWAELQRLTAPDGARGSEFGRAVDASGDVLIVGAPAADDGRGAVHLFRRSETGWTPTATLEWDRGASRAGSAVAVGHGVAAFVERSGATEQVRIVSVPGVTGGDLRVEGTAAPASGDTRYGAALAIPAPGTLLVCGADARGSIVLDRHTRGPDGRWGRAERVEVGLPIAGPAGLLEQDPYLECSLDATSERVALGAPRASGGGRAVLFDVGGHGALERDTALAPPAGSGAAAFGLAVALTDGATGVGASSTAELWVGAPESAGLLGRVYRYEADGSGSWSVAATLEGPGTDFMPAFGLAVAADRDAAVVGAPGDDYGAGIALPFDRRADGWSVGEPITVEAESYAAVTGERVECQGGEAAVFACSEIDLVALLPVDQLGASRGSMVNDVWGWADPETGREIAVVGRSDGTSFVDVTDPTAPLYLGQMPKTPGSRGNAWRDVKVLDGYALVVADNAGAHGMQIFDLRRLRDVDAADPPTFEADAIYDEIDSSHNLIVNEESGYAYLTGGGCGSLHIVDLRDPLNPRPAGCYFDPAVGLGASGGTHDAQCVVYEGPDAGYRGREICFAFAESAISIGDVTDKAEPQIITQARYPNSAYTHQGWLTEDHRYLYVNDELDELAGLTERTRTMIWDVAELDDPQLVGEYLHPTRATDHNLYVAGSLMYQSNYAAGLRLIDVSDPENPREIGFFDTAPFGPDAPGFFDGSWSNYPFFPSGNILVTSHHQGLFVLKRRPPIS